MNAREMVVEQIDAKLRSLTTIGYAMDKGYVIDIDDELAHEPDATDVDSLMETPQQYANTLVVDVFGNDEGLQLALTMGGPYVCAQHIADLEVWYLIGRSSSYRRTKTLDPDEHSDAIRALDYLLDLHKDQMPSIG